MMAPGTLIGTYRVESLIGRGGMGVVYEATQLALERPVALKLLHAELSEDPAFIERFRREGRLQAALEHPNVVTVYEAGESEHGLFLAMQLVRGVSLAELLRTGSLDPARAVELLGQVAGALDAAHAGGFVHRDVKPRNVLVDSSERAFLADFGLTRGSGEAGLTASGELVGTVAYLAPETLHGAEATPASDRYAFAAMLFECLAGEAVFPRSSDAAVIYAHASEPPPRISERRPGLPPALDKLFERALAKEPERRPEQAGALVAGARALLGAEAIETRSRPSTPPSAPRPERREERKIVTVLFADLVGFTARAEQLDPEDVRAFLQPYHARLRSELERFGGTVEKFIGDAVVALFGAPVAHEDDPERAVRAALAIRDWASEDGQLELRIAVATGEALVTLGARPDEGEGMAVGDVVNTAARVQAAAPTNGILVGEQTYRATAQAIDYREADPVVAKGKSEPIPVWEALQARSRYGVDIEHAARAPLVGRDYDLNALRDALQRARSRRTAQLVTLVGVPGIGKSRLVYELTRIVETDPELVTWRQGRSLPYGEGMSFWALGEMVKAEAGILETDGPEEANRKLDQALEQSAVDPADRPWIAGNLRTLVGLGGEGARPGGLAEAFAAWRGFLEALAEQRPLVLAFEDIHWADDGLLDFVDELLDRATGVPMLVLCTARPELLERRPGWGGGKPNALTISLAPLADDETARLVATLLDRPVIPVDTQGELLTRAGGNPLYAEQYARMLLEGGALDALPESVQGIIAARLDGLSRGEKQLLQDGAVVGKVFWLGAVVGIDGFAGRQAEELLHALERKEFVQRARRSSVAGEAEYAFRHVLLRDVAYAQIPRAVRAEKHRLAAEWIESLGRPEDHAELLADHSLRALEYSRASGVGVETTEIEEKAARFLVLAGDRTFQLDAAKADAYYGRALELLAEGDPARPDVLAKRGETSKLSARTVEAERYYEEAIAAFEVREDRLGAGQTMVRLALTASERGDSARSRQLVADAVTLLEREPAGPELAQAYAATARSLMVSGRARESLSWSDKALVLAERFGLQDLLVRLPQFRGVARWDSGDVGGLEDLREALRLGLELGLGYETSTAYINLAHFVWLKEGAAQALELARAGVDFAGRRGMPGQVLWSQGELQWYLFDLGEWNELLELADDLIERDDARGGSQVGVSARAYKAQVLVHRGQVDEAASRQEEALLRGREIGDPQILGPALAASAFVEEARGRKESAIALIDELGELTRERDPWHRTRYAPDAARILVAGGVRDVGRHLRLDDTGVIGTRPLTSLLAARAVMAEAGGDFEKAVDLHDQAAGRWAEYGFVLEHGQALFGLGRCLFRLARPDEAVAKLREARDVFARLHARPLVAKIDVLLEEPIARAGRNP